WTNNSVAPRTNIIYVTASDRINSSWTNSVTNEFSLIFLPPQRPYLNPPTNETVFVGQTFTDVLAATNWVLPLANYTYAPGSAFTNGTIAAGALNWTNALVPPGIYAIPVKVTDNSVPPISATINFVVTVLPLPGQLNLGNASVPPGANAFQFTIATPWANSAWRIEAATNLAAGESGWLPIYTNLAGSSSLIFTDLLTTNFPQRYYRAVFP
ncbi:MAG TPA: hypothetical protein VL970_08900, partial [Candidatus Acidoferrales bacterium]|nr:hypothetical protein [Candidatus Acidoferrales bacterium]